MKLKELAQERGRIVHLFVTVELAINTIISRHYLGNSPDSHKLVDFQFNVLGNDQCTFGFKRNILQHVLKVDNLDGSMIEELHRLNNIRNTFAHRPFLTDPPNQDPESLVYFSNPRFPWDISKNIPASTLQKEYDSLYPDVLNWLYQLCIKKGAVFPTQQIGPTTS